MCVEILKVSFSKMRWLIEVMGITHLLFLDFPIVLRPKKCQNYVEHWGLKKPRQQNYKSRLSEEENGAGVQVTLGRACGDRRCTCVRILSLSISSGCNSVLCQTQKTLLVKRSWGLSKISLLISSPKSHMWERTDRAVGVKSSPGKLLNSHLQHHIYLLKDLLV